MDVRRSPGAGLAIVVAAGVALTLALTLSGCGSPAAQTPSAGRSATGSASTGPASSYPAAPPAVSASAARQVVAAYIADNNRSNRLRSDRVLATFEGGSSRAIDAASYAQTKAAHPKNSGYAPFTYVDQAYYIPAQSGYPYWFVFRGTIRDLKAGAKPAKGSTYILFVRQSAGSRWLNMLEPNAGGVTAPPVAITSAGLAAPVTGTGAAGLAIPPDQLAAREAAALTGSRRTTPLANDTMAGNWLGGQIAYWAKFGLRTSTTFRAPGGPAYALRTAAGGALVMGYVTGKLTVRAPAGQRMTSVGIRGIVSGRNVTKLVISIDGQYLVSDPPAGHGKPALLGYLAGFTGGSTS